MKRLLIILLLLCSIFSFTGISNDSLLADPPDPIMPYSIKDEV